MDENPFEIITRGRNRLTDENFEWKHVAHAEIVAMTELNRINSIRRENRQDLYEPLESDLWSSLGPCIMCLCATVNERIKRVHTLAPDWTSPTTMDGLATLSSGYGSKIAEYGITSDEAPVEMIPFENEAKKIRLLCWAVSRIKRFEFNKDEHEKGYKYLTNEALLFAPWSVDDLVGKVHDACAEHGLTKSDLFVRITLEYIETAFGNLSIPTNQPIMSAADEHDAQSKSVLMVKMQIIAGIIQFIGVSPEKIGEMASALPQS